MPIVQTDTKHRRHDYVTHVEITVGDENVRHHFGRKVQMSHARKFAQHYLDVLTGEPSDFRVNQDVQS